MLNLFLSFSHLLVTRTSSLLVKRQKRQKMMKTNELEFKAYVESIAYIKIRTLGDSWESQDLWVDGYKDKPSTSTYRPLGARVKARTYMWRKNDVKGKAYGAWERMVWFDSKLIKWLNAELGATWRKKKYIINLR